MKLITFTVPCYNSAAYMDRCVETLLPAGKEAEIILVDDGSTDDTGKVADAYAEKYPDIVRVIHQENGGHGEGVNQGIRNATGMFFKVVDSDDWLDTEALAKVMEVLRSYANAETPLDLLMANYVYEHVADNTRNVVDYTGILPENRVFHWDEIGKFPPDKNILMHSVIYRTEVLRAEWVSYTPELFARLKLERGDRCYHLVRMRYVSGKPFVLVENYVPESVFPGIDAYNFAQRSLYDVFETVYHEKIVKSRRVLMAQTANIEFANLFGVHRGSPVLYVENTVMDQNDRPIDLSKEYLDGVTQKFEFEVVNQ